jgi:cytochrome c oxidase cbb3-type subunit 3
MPTRIVRMGIIALGFGLGACGGSEGGSTPGPPASGLPSEDVVAAVPMDHVAGLTDSTALARSIRNPYAGNEQAIEAGHALYTKMNCAGCHAYNAKGNMGPNLTDTYWRYGGFPIDIYKSIHDGRAQGMPAWGSALPPQEIWKLVAYIQSLGGSFAVDGEPRNAQRSELVAPELQAHGDHAANAARADTQPEAPGPAATPPPAPATPAATPSPTMPVPPRSGSSSS